MKAKYSFKIWVFLFCWLLFATIAGSCAETAKLVILHTNDMHGQLFPQVAKYIVDPPKKAGGLPYLATVIEQQKTKYAGDYLLIDDGDFAQGTLESNSFYGAPMIKFFNYLGYEALELGNHELDWGMKNLKETLSVAKFPILCANLVDAKTSRPLPFAKPYIIKQEGDLKVGIIGVLTPYTEKITRAENMVGLKFLDPVEVVRQLTPILKSKGVNFIILMSHCGVDEDEKMAALLPQVGIIVGGHSHTWLKEAEKIGDVIIVQAHWGGRVLGRIELEVDKDTGKVVSYQPKEETIPIIADDITPDATMLQMVNDYQDKVKEIKERIVGKTEISLGKTEANIGLDSPLGDLITDALRDAASADVAIYNPGGIRGEIEKGAITFGDVFSVLPFDDAVVRMQVTGKMLKATLEKGCDPKRAAQLSGVKLVYNPDGKPGERITELFINGEPFNPDKTYTLATTEFLAGGGEGYDFKAAKDVRYYALGRDVFADYISKHSPIKEIKTGRIQQAQTLPPGKQIVPKTGN